MVVTEYKVLSTQSPTWQRDAVRLANERTPFAIVGFNFEWDRAFFQALTERFELEGTVDQESGQAYFKPRAKA